MKIKDVMNSRVRCCRPDDSLATVGELLWKSDCGIVPVVDEGERLVGVITDRDVCIALTTRDARASEIPVRDVARSEVSSCAPDSSIESAMGTMRRSKVRRLPVVENGRLVGILSLNDLILAAQSSLGPVDYEDLVGTLRAVSEHRGESSTQEPPRMQPGVTAAVA